MKSECINCVYMINKSNTELKKMCEISNIRKDKSIIELSINGFTCPYYRKNILQERREIYKNKEKNDRRRIYLIDKYIDEIIKGEYDGIFSEKQKENILHELFSDTNSIDMKYGIITMIMISLSK